MKKVISWLDYNLEEVILLVLLGIISVTMMLQIIMRYLFSSPLSWVEELCRYCFVYSGMISAGYCLRRRVGIRVDLVVNFLPKALQIVVEYLSRVLMIAMYGYMAYSSIDLIRTTTTLSSAMQLPMQYVYLAIPIGLGLGVLRGIQDVILYTKELMQKGKKEDAEVC